MREEKPLAPISALVSATSIQGVPRQFPAPLTLTSNDSGLFLFPSVQLQLHPKDRLKSRNTDSKTLETESPEDRTDSRQESPVVF